MEKCIWCEGVYEPEESTASKKKAFCSKECEEKFKEWADEPLEFTNV